MHLYAVAVDVRGSAPRRAFRPWVCRYGSPVPTRHSAHGTGSRLTCMNNMYIACACACNMCSVHLHSHALVARVDVVPKHVYTLDHSPRDTHTYRPNEVCVYAHVTRHGTPNGGAIAQATRINLSATPANAAWLPPLPHLSTLPWELRTCLVLLDVSRRAQRGRQTLSSGAAAAGA